MKKRDAFLLGAEAGGFVDEANAGGATTLQGGVDVIDGEADVMDPRPSLGHEAADRRVRGFGFEQFDERVAGGQPDDRSTIGIVQRHFRQVEDVTIEWQDLFKGSDRDTDMRETSSATS